MTHGFKVENGILTLDVFEILKYPILAKLYNDDTSIEKEYAYKLFLYMYHIADKDGYCRKNGLGEKDSHEWAVRNSKLREGFKLTQEIRNGIEFIKSELPIDTVESLIENNIAGLNVSSRAINVIVNKLQYVIDNDIKGDDAVLEADKLIQRILKTANDIPERVKALTSLKEEWEQSKKGGKVLRGNKVYSESYDGNDDLASTAIGGVEELDY